MSKVSEGKAMRRKTILDMCSCYSQGEFSWNPRDIVDMANKHGVSAVALTDVNSVGGYYDLYYASQRFKKCGFKAVYGVKLYCLFKKGMSPSLITLLARNKAGLRNLFMIMSEGYRNRLHDSVWPCITCEDIEMHRKGIIVGMDYTFAEPASDYYSLADYVVVRPPVTKKEIVSLQASGKVPVGACLENKGLYSYLGEAIAERLIVDNPNMIAEQIDADVFEDNHAYGDPAIPDSMQIVEESCRVAMKEKYKGKAPGLIEERLHEELDIIRENDYASSFVLEAKLIERCKELGFTYSEFGNAGGLLTSYLMGISKCNPMPGHFYCPVCGRVEFTKEKDMTMTCPDCGERMNSDGFDIPIESCFSFYRDRAPGFFLSVPYEMRKEIIVSLEKLFGKERAFCAGCRYSVNTCRDPNVYVIVPEGEDIYDYSPLGYCSSSEIDAGLRPIVLLPMFLPSVHIGFNKKLSKLRLMEECTGIPAESIDVSCVYLGESNSSWLHKNGIENGSYIDESCAQIAYREDVMDYLIEVGMEKEDAFKISEMVRKGKASSKTFDHIEKRLLYDYEVTEDYIEALENVKYITSRSRGVENLDVHLRMKWYQDNYPSLCNFCDD